MAKSKKKLPHFGVYTRLGRSKIRGVGVFAITNIKKGTPLFEGDITGVEVWVPKDKISELPPNIKKLYKDFGVYKAKQGEYGCPKNFNQLTMGWYINHSKTPNVKCRRDYEFFALQDIKEGDELTVDYATYSDEPPNS